MDQIDEAVPTLLPRALELLRDLVRADSTIGREAAAQDVLGEALAGLGFSVTRFAIPEDIAGDPLAGVGPVPYTGRGVLVAHRTGTAPNAAPSLLINGHIDVVPAEDAGGWSTPPFEPLDQDGWIVGRGAGDMKSGFALGWLAIAALDEAQPGWQRGDLVVVAAIEEECTGNGTLASIRAGVTADAALLLEPTDLDLLLAGIAITWIEITIEGRSGHAEAAGRSVNPVLSAVPVLGALQGFERRMNEEHRTDGDAAFAALENPYLVNVGRMESGSWASSVPEVARLGVRVGHPAAWTAEQALEAVRAAVLDAVRDDEWLTEHPPAFRLNGYRAERYAQDPEHPFVRRLAAAHRDAHGVEPAAVAIGSTTDARYYVNQARIPTVAYGARTRNMHGVDEAVEVASIADGARTLTRFLADWLGGTAGP